MPDIPSVLDLIEQPADLRKLSREELARLAEEIRDRIIGTVSRTGGHLASNLGVVELTIALHRAFDSPKDKIVWDVGHQSYAHKLLTGRAGRFATLRQAGGLSGFTRRDESPHDPYGAGHASTSISAALGLAKARDLRGGKEHVVAVIGDGAMTGGLALEGLNNAQDLDTDIIVMLNDNEMSIAENVTAISVHLSKLRAQPLYQLMERRAKTAMQRLPHGRTLAKTAEGIYHGVTHLMAAETGVFFEDLGFRYFGPIDGHNVELMDEVFALVKRLKGPVLVHVLTTKGKGYPFAENDSRQFHGIPGFHIADGNVEPANGNITFTQAFGETLVEMARHDERIVAITAAMPDGTGLSEFAREFPERFFDVGIAEAHAVTFAAGLAAAGMRPFVAIYSTFLQRAYDQIIHDVCLQHLPVVFALDRAGLVGDDGPTHHGAFDVSYLRHIPGMCVMAPKDPDELRRMMATSMEHNGPSAIRYPRGGCSTIWKRVEMSCIPIGKAEMLVSGADAAIVALGPLCGAAVQGAEELRGEGIDVSIVNARFVRPLDETLILELAASCRRLVVVEENAMAGGLGSAILELLSDKGLNDVVVKRLGLPDRFIEHGSQSILRDSVGLTSVRIAEAVREVIAAEIVVSVDSRTETADRRL